MVTSHEKSETANSLGLKNDVTGHSALVWRYFVLTTNTALDPLLVDIDASLVNI